jgi:hypothetical protein
MVYENGLRLKDSVYNVLKWIAIIVLPALSVLYGTLARIWGLPYGTEIPLTIDAIDVFIGALIGISHLSIKKEESNEA